MSGLWRRREDGGAVAVLYSVVLSFVIVPLLAVGTTTYVRATSTGELQRAADSGALAAAAQIPLGDVTFAADYLSATSGGTTGMPLSALGLTYSAPDPLAVACQQAVQSAKDTGNIGPGFGGSPTCHASYLTDNYLLSELSSCAAGLTAPTLPPMVPDLSPLLPALLRPGVKVDMSWQVHGPLDAAVRSSSPGTTETASAIAHRRFKDMVVVPQATLPTGTTIDLTPYVGDVRTLVTTGLTGTEQLLNAVPALAPCAAALDGSSDDILDAVNPPAGGPDMQAVLADAATQQAPLMVLLVVNGLSVPFLDFVPVCVEQVGGDYVGHLADFGACSLVAPGAFRASLRRS